MKSEEGNGVEADESRLSAMVDIVASLGPDSVLKNGLAGKSAELTPGTPVVAKEALASDREGIDVSAEVSAEVSISVFR